MYAVQEPQGILGPHGGFMALPMNLTPSSVENQEAVGVDPGTTAAHTEAAVGSTVYTELLVTNSRLEN